MMFTGTYPVLYDRSISPVDYFPILCQTYIERDVREKKTSGTCRFSSASSDCVPAAKVN